MSEKTNQNIEEDIRQKYNGVSKYLNEKSRRIWAATEARSLGKGGISIVCRSTGITHKTIKKGLDELNFDPLAPGKIRAKGGGRKSITEVDANLESALLLLVEATTRGDPESPLLWTCKSTYNLCDELNAQGHCVSQKSIYTLLKKLGYSLQGNRKTEEGGKHPDRNAQFQYIYDKTKKFQGNNNPVISVDTKKKENIGNFKNNGREYHLKGNAPQVNVYDFIDKEKGKVSPYGVYDLSKNNGWVSVGVSSDTSEFAINSILSWWKEMGVHSYPNAKEIYINADGGGSNGWRTRLWKVELQRFSNTTGLIIHVSHFPPGTSKWNKIEHRMFSFISHNWRGHPLIDRATVVNLIANTKTKKGLSIKARLDENIYKKGRKISDKELSLINLVKDEFHGEWNYHVKPD